MKPFLKHLILVVILLNTTDVYSQWSLIKVFYSGVVETNFSFSDSQNGYVYYGKKGTPSSGGPIYIVKTSDSGKNWEWVYSNSGYVSISDIASTHADSVFFLLSNTGMSSVNYSFNSGEDWERGGLGVGWTGDMFALNSKSIYAIRWGIGKGGLYKFKPDSVSVLLEDSDTIRIKYSTIFFVNPQRGYLTARDNSAQTILITTADGGRNWSIAYRTPENIFTDLYFTSDSVGYLTCTNGAILKTVNYGENFKELNTSNDIRLNDIQFINDSCGYSVGNNGTLIYTRNAGETWDFEATNTSYNLKKIQMFNEDTGYFLNTKHELFGKGINITNTVNYTNKAFKIYPNPATDYIFLNKEVDELVVYNTQGQKLTQHADIDNRINISNFEKGIYFFKIKIGNDYFTYKIIKN